MSDADDEPPAAVEPTPPDKELTSMSPQHDPNSIMDLDFADLDSCWAFDPIPTSPLLISISDQPVSSFWAEPDDKSAFTAAGGGGFSVSPDCRFFTCNSEAAGENQKDNDCENFMARIPTPVLELSSLELPDVFIIKERMTQALRYFKESTQQHQILAQVWAPIKSGNKYVLRTSGQPFFLSTHGNGLHQYRTVSQMYSFSMDDELDGSFGLPGRVFKQKVPEWTPDVQFYSCKEYPRIRHARHYNVHGSLALPVFEPSGQSCVGVLELIMTSQKINYASEVDKVCKALEAVNLKSSEILDQPNIQICNEARQNALAEILEVFTEACETYKLPLAQTWIPCRHQNVTAYGGGGVKKSCSNFDGSCMGQVCMSTIDVAYYIIDAHVWGFRDACAEHHLQKGQGVAGRAFSSHGLCFCEDIRRFSKTDYPLVHYAKMFGLSSSFAICLRSTYTGEDDYVLEFFLPTSITDSSEQHKLLDFILATMKYHFRSLTVASGKVLEEEKKCMEILDMSIDESPDSKAEPVLVSYPSNLLPVLQTSNGDLVAPPGTSCQNVEEREMDEMKKAPAAGGSFDGASPSVVKETNMPSERKHRKAEKRISLETLQQYFSGSLKDAAKALGVCPTTMKRICRQHGISRWPSRKINKVNRSLSKLRRVLESVQCADGVFRLPSISPNTAPVAVGPISRPAGLNGASQQQSLSSKPYEFPDKRIDMPASRTPGTNGHEEAKTGEIKGRASSHDEEVNEQNGFLRDFEVSRARSGSGRASNGSSASHESCQGSPATESTPPDGHLHEQGGISKGLMLRTNGEMSYPAAFSLPDAVLVPQNQEPFGSMLLRDGVLKDDGSSKDMRNLCSSVADAKMEDGMLEPVVTNPPTSDHHAPNPTTSPINPTMPSAGARQEMQTVTVKATFREDMIRFRFSLNSNTVDLREEVAKRLKLEVGTFEIKYLDEDHEWVLISCESDLQECVDITRSSGSSVIRMSIHDVVGNPGSSCESIGECKE